MTTMVGLLVEYKAKTSELDNAMMRMSKQLDEVKNRQKTVEDGFGHMHSSMSNGLQGILGWWKEIVAIIGAGILLHKFQEIAESIDKISKAAGVLGISVESFQRLSYVADLAGVSNDELSASFKKLQMSLGQGLQGSDKIAASFKILGLSMKDIQGKDIAEQYTIIAKALENVKDKNLQASVASTFFGKNYTSTLKMIRQDIGETTKEFDKLGLALSDSQAKAVEDFNDSETRLGAIWQGFSQKIVAFIAPAFEKILTFINDTIIKFGGIDAVAKKFSEAIVSGVQWAVEAINGLLNQIDSIYARMLKIRIFAAEINGGKSAIPDPFVLTKALYEKFSGSTSFSESRGQSAGNLPNLYKQLHDVEQNIETRKDFLKPLIDVIQTDKDKISNVLESVIPNFRDTGKASNDLTDKMISAGKKVDDFLSNMIKSEGQSKLQKILGTDKATGKSNEVDNEVWNNMIKDIYNKALNGSGGQVQTGTFNGKTISNRVSTAEEDLNRLKSAVQGYGSGGDVSGIKGYIGAIDELTAFLKKLDPATNKVKVDIEVKTEEGFLLKVAQSAELQKQMQKEVMDIAQKAAKMGAK